MIEAWRKGLIPMDISDKPSNQKSLEMAKNSSNTEVYMATLTFLAKCSEAGLYYR